MHLQCAEQWFGLKRMTQCEVCRQEATGLPPPLRDRIQAAAAAAAAEQDRLAQLERATRPARDLAPRFFTRQTPNPFNYFYGCLAPASCSVITMVFTLLHLRTSVGIAFGLAVATSVLPVVHWLILPEMILQAWLFTVSVTGCTLGAFYFFHILLKLVAWFAAAFSAVTGLVLGLVAYGNLSVAVLFLSTCLPFIAGGFRISRVVHPRGNGTGAEMVSVRPADRV